MYNKCECMQIGGKEWRSFQCKRSYIYIYYFNLFLVHRLHTCSDYQIFCQFHQAFVCLFVEPKTISIILIIFTPQPCRYFNLIEVICYLHSGVWYLCISINYNLFLTNCYLCPAHMASFVN